MSSEVFLALGSNIGNRESSLLIAIKKINDLPKTAVIKVSDIYETEPVGYTGQGHFLNMSVKIRTELLPLQLLHEFQRIELELGRERIIRFGPRTIDIDILMYDNLAFNDSELTIPHPRMHERAFVLIPLKDVYDGREICGSEIDALIGSAADRHGVRLYKVCKGVI